MIEANWNWGPLYDVLEGWETPERARQVYGVALTGSIAAEDLAVDTGATEALRSAGAAKVPA